MNAALSRVQRLPSQRERRLILGLYAAGLLIVLVLLSLRLNGSFDAVAQGLRPALMALYLLGFGLTLYGVWKLSFPARLGLPQGHDHELDERQLLRVAQASTLAYRLVSLALLVLAAAFVIGSVDLARLAGRSDGVGGIMFVALFLLPHLPTAILAWTEPDLDRPDMPE